MIKISVDISAMVYGTVLVEVAEDGSSVQTKIDLTQKGGMHPIMRTNPALGTVIPLGRDQTHLLELAMSSLLENAMEALRKKIALHSLEVNQLEPEGGEPS